MSDTSQTAGKVEVARGGQWPKWCYDKYISYRAKQSNSDHLTADRPLVSVIIPNLDKGAYVKDAIMSILAQSYDNFEIIFTDNGSSDGSQEIAEKLSATDSRIVVLNEPRRGVSFAKNRGLSRSRGELVTFLDSDDICAKNRLMQEVDLLTCNPKLSCCHTNGWIIDEFGKSTGQVYHDDIVPLPSSGVSEDIFRSLLKRNFVMGGSVMLWKSQVEGDWFDTQVGSAEDWDFNLRLACNHAFGYLAAPLYGYRIYPGNQTWKSQLSSHHLIYEKYLRTLSANDEDRMLVLSKLMGIYLRNRNYAGLARLLLIERAALRIAYQRVFGNSSEFGDSEPSVKGTLA